MPEKLCLQRDDFNEDVSIAFETLRNEKDFTDVTLVCEDGKQVEAHKVILASSSPFFKNLLNRNKHSHPLIYMRGVGSDTLEAIMDFLYFGKANVFQENLDLFLAIGKDLQLKGLTETEDAAEEIKQETFEKYEGERENPLSRQETDTSVSAALPGSNFEIFASKSDLSDGPVSQTQVSQTQTLVSQTQTQFPSLQDIDKKCKSLMEKTSTKLPNGNLLYKCKACGKVAIRTQMKNHIEENHLEGEFLPCNLCEQTFNSGDLLAKHFHRNHK